MFEPVPRKGTLKLMKLFKQTLNGDEESKDELFKYIGRLENSETVLLQKIHQFSKDFITDK